MSAPSSSSSSPPPRRRCVVIMFDTLCRHFLPPYGNEWVKAPNFVRLAKRTCQFNQFYVGSMPCMPARRELHTGRHNFLHRSWGPLEPFDDSAFELLHEAGVHTHKATDHHHYWEDGGATYVDERWEAKEKEAKEKRRKREIRVSCCVELDGARGTRCVDDRAH